MMRRALRAARAAVVEYLLAAEQGGVAGIWRRSSRALASSQAMPELDLPGASTMCAVSLSPHGRAGEARRPWKTPRGAGAATAKKKRRIAGRRPLRRRPAPTTRTPATRTPARGDTERRGREGEPPRRFVSARDGRGREPPRRRSRRSRVDRPRRRGAQVVRRNVPWFPSRYPAGGAKYRRAFDPDAGGSDGAGTDEEERGEVHPGDTDTTPRGGRDNSKPTSVRAS